MTELLAAALAIMIAWGWIVFRNKGQWVNRKLMVGRLFVASCTSPLGQPVGLFIAWGKRTILDWRRGQ